MSTSATVKIATILHLHWLISTLVFIGWSECLGSAVFWVVELLTNEKGPCETSVQIKLLAGHFLVLHFDWCFSEHVCPFYYRRRIMIGRHVDFLAA